MFAIYGTSGLMYRGPLEDMRKVAPTLRAGRARALTPDLDRPAAESPAAVAAEAESRPAQQALSAYGRVQHPPTERRPLQIVSDVMSRRAVVVRQDMSVREGWWTLYEHGVGQAPVLNAEGAVVGLLSRAELMQPDRLPQPGGHALVWQALLAQPVSEVMVSPVPCVSPDTDLRRLAQALLDTGLQGLPVVDADGRLLGFVSRSDILKAVVHDPPLDLWAG